MASVYSKFVNGGRATAESTLLLGTNNAAHFFSIVADKELDNGNVCAYPNPANWENDYFKVAAPKAADEIVLHLSSPKLYEDWTKSFQHEDNFFLAKGEIGRAYEIKKGDRFSVSDEAFDDDADLENHKYVIVSETEDFKLTTSATDKSTTNAFLGFVLHDQVNGLHTIFVMKNRA